MGHLFIVDGDLTKLSCDAWLLPTDHRFSVSESFAKTVRLDHAGILSAEPWAEGERVRPLTDDPPGTDPWIWLGDIGRNNQPAEWYADQALEFIEKASFRIGRFPKSNRTLPLLAVNLLGSGHGGKASEKGSLCEVLIPKLRSAAEANYVDVVLVTWGRAAYSAAQRVRQNLVLGEDPAWTIEKAWSLGSNAPTLVETATELAKAVQADNLVLFFGAGVSIDAGVPAWQGLLDQIAIKAELGDKVSQLRKLDLRDQAAILGRRLQQKNLTLGQLVKEHTTASRCSLAHSLLASLGVREAVTTNYDNLFEVAVGERENGLAILPGDAVAPRQRWLLKLHGSIEDEGNLVITRDDYLGVATRRGALLGLVQAMLLTRKMFFVGYSLSDEDFHSVMSDVRMAASAGQKLGVAITLFQDEFFEELWSDDLDVVGMSSQNEKPSESEAAEAARLVLIFLDLVAYLAADLHAFLLNPEYEGMLTTEEKALVTVLEQVSVALPPREGIPAWGRVRLFLESFDSESSE